nr:flagellar filament capping protein FliD [uncultured Acetatifactor sp.]
MPMRLSGLMSGMDTESIIQQLVSAKKTKVTKAVKAQKTLKYKQDAWKDLNKQIVNLYNKSLTQMRFQSSYMKKVTKVSNSSIVSVITGENAMNSVQSLEVNQLARSGYLTGGQIGANFDSEGNGLDANGQPVTSKTKLSDLGYAMGEGSLRLKTVDGVAEITLDENSTIGNFVTALKEAGLNANFDEANGRIHITSKGSGTKNDFSIIANDGAGWRAMAMLGLDYKDDSALDNYASIFNDDTVRNLLDQKSLIGKIKDTLQKNASFKSAWDTAISGSGIDVTASNFEYNKLAEDKKKKFDEALSTAIAAAGDTLSGGNALWADWNTNKNKLSGVTTGLNEAVDAKIAAEQNNYLGKLKTERDTLLANKANLETDQNDYLTKIKTVLNDSDVKTAWEDALKDALGATSLPFDVTASDFNAAKYNALDQDQKQAFETAMQQAFNKAYEKALNDPALSEDDRNAKKEELENLNSDWNTTVSDWNSTEASQKSVESNLVIDASGSVTGLSDASKDSIENTIRTAVDMYETLSNSSAVYSGHKDNATDAKVTLNGVEYKADKNTLEINGLTLTVSATTAPGESVTITTEDDTNGIYDMVKNFFKEYNAVINQMDKLYNAEAAKGYEPLTDEEKEAMSDSQIEEWENKIKDSILRKDSTLSFFASEMKRIMMEGVEMEDGKKMYLSNFGIGTLNYYVAKDNERYAYHIDGDPDDENTANNPDKLKSMIANDPDTVVSFFTKLSQKMSDKMFEMMRSEEGVSSAMTAYEDKKMQKEYDDYTAKIKELEKKLADYEDKWYAKFAAMETALAKMQNNASAVTSLLGG